MQALRDYQDRAVKQTLAHHAAGRRRVIIVSPTGSGKSVIGTALALTARRVLWLAHRTELVNDAAARLRAELGPLEVGVIAAGVSPSPYSRVQVSSVQTLVKRGIRPEADLVIPDESHHFVADQWSKLVSGYPEAAFAMLTATPERQDGRALGDIAEVMVVAAEYSELLAAGHLVPIRAFRPKQILGSNLAQDPVDAWARYSDGGCGFAFHPTVEIAHSVTARMKERGIRAACIEQGTKAGDRAAIIEAMRSGELDCINNVYTMTEGVDVPRARVCMLASAAHHCGGYLQKAGRVLRPHPSKTDAILIDLVGASILHGLPTEDRIYSLDGEPIKRTSVQPLRSCLSCGAVVHAAYAKCPECGYVFPAEARKGPKIYSLELEEVFAGKDTPEQAKRAEYAALRRLQKTNGYDLYFVVKKYRDLFGESVIIADATSAEKREFLAKLQNTAKARGFKPGFAKVQFKNTFGHWPNG